MKQTAIATLVIGEPYQSIWSKHCLGDWYTYAQRIDAELLVFQQPLDLSPRALARSASWQKLLLLSTDACRNFRQVAILDCDIAINSQHAPNIFEQVDEEHVGGVINGSQLHADFRPMLLRLGQPYQRGLAQWQADQDRHYRKIGLEPRPEGLIQGGVLVASPQHHAELFSNVYLAGFPETHTYEQVPLSHALLSGGFFREIDTRFNCVFQETAGIYYPYVLYGQFEEKELLTKWAVRTMFTQNFFLHFAAAPQFMRYLQD